MSPPPSPSGEAEQRRPLRVALLGAGIFATNCHAPILRDDSGTTTSSRRRFDCRAVWSRTLTSAEKLASTFVNDQEAGGGDDGEGGGRGCRAYGGEGGLVQVLERSDVDAVVMALPLDVQPGYVLRALDAGKHVLSEKPVAPTVEVGRGLVREYEAKYRPKGLLWSVGENLRYEPGLLRAADLIREGAVGTPLLLTLAVHSPFRPDNRYLATPWRSEPSWGTGGLFVDAFVHGAAALRLLAGGAGGEPTAVSATTTSRADHIPGVDTLAANVRFDKEERRGKDATGGGGGGSMLLQGVVTASYAGVEGRFELDVTGTEGRVAVSRVFGESPPGYLVTSSSPGGRSGGGCGGGGGSRQFFPFGGIEAEFVAFADSCSGEAASRDGSGDGGGGAGEAAAGDADRNTPQEALADLSFVEACLESGKAGAELRPLVVGRTRD